MKIFNLRIAFTVFGIVLPCLLCANPIVRIEYFIDSDPGWHQATSLPSTTADSISISSTIPVNGLALGMHTVGFRAIDNNDVSSAPFFRSFWIDRVIATPHVVQIEYFIDRDPGYGNGISPTFEQGSSVGVSLCVATDTLSIGMHVLVVRVRAADNRWSTSFNRPFWVEPIRSEKSVVAAEYYVDRDPGVGQAIPYPVIPNVEVNQSFVLATDTLSPGLHLFGMRFRDSSGNWTIALQKGFWVERIHSVASVNAAEYYIDSDPGFNLATSIPVVAGESATIPFTALLSGQANGNHELIVRVRNTNGVWSVAEQYRFVIADAPDAPTLLVISYSGSNAVLQWTAPSTAVDGFRIYRNSLAYFMPPAQNTLIGSVTGATTTFTDYNVSDKYYYRVSSFNTP